MAQPSQTLNYVCRNCRKALNTNGFRIQQSRDLARSFSNSRSLAKTLATFTPTSSPELDALLTSWRKEIFLPSILSPHHQDLVYKVSRKEILTTPPGVNVTVQTALSPSAPNASSAEEETIKLQPMNRWDRPNLMKGFNQFTRHLAENPDAQTWDNLIPFLEGLRIARIETDSKFLPRLARKASDRRVARWNTILTAATMNKRTGVTLAQQALTRELVLGTFQRAAEGQFSNPEPAKTLKRITLLLDAPEHCGGRIPSNTKKTTYADMRRDPTVLAVQAAFAAANVLRTSAGKDVDGTAARCIQKLLLLETAKAGGLLESFRVDVPSTISNEEKWLQSTILTNLSPLYAALALTLKVNMQESLGREKAVKTHVEIQRLLGELETRISAAKGQLVKAEQARKGSKDGFRGMIIMEGLEKTLKSV